VPDLTLTRRTAKGIAWTAIAQAVRLGLTFLIVAVLARLLNPKDFGLIAMVAVFTNLFLLLNDLGLSAALVQKSEVEEQQLSSAFWINLIEGVAVTGLFVAAAPLVASFYSKPVLLPIMIVLSVNFTLSSFGIIQFALFSREMDFKTLSIIEMIAAAAAGIIAIIFAVLGFGVWSLVAQSLISTGLTAFLLFFRCEWKPRRFMRWKPVRELLRFGLPLMGFNLINYFSRNTDNLLIGKFLGSTPLGYYDLAYRLLLFPLGNVSMIFGRVMFPALSRIKHDKARVRSAYIRATRLIAVVVFPVMAGAVVLAQPFVRVVFGTKWGPSAFLIEVLSLVAIIQSVGSTVGWIYQSQGRTGVLFKWGIFATAICITGIGVGLIWGVDGVAVGYAIAVILLLYPLFAIPFRFIDMNFLHFVGHFKYIAGATVITAALILGIRMLFEKLLGTGDLLMLLVSIAVGAVAYLVLISVLDKGVVDDFFEMARELKAGGMA